MGYDEWKTENPEDYRPEVEPRRFDAECRAVDCNFVGTVDAIPTISEEIEAGDDGHMSTYEVLIALEWTCPQCGKKHTESC